MAIKKSNLEERWYYRAGKAFLLILPLLIIIWLLLARRAVVCNFVPAFSPEQIIYAVLLIVFYYVLLNIVWRSLLYVIFGGLDDDLKHHEKSEEKSGNAVPVLGKRGQLLPFIIFLIIIAILILAQMGYMQLPKFDPGNFNLNFGTSCYRTSAEWKHPCHSSSGGVAVSALPIPASCDCPVDTEFAQMDNTAPGGPYKICVCR